MYMIISLQYHLNDDHYILHTINCNRHRIALWRFEMVNYNVNLL